MALRWIDSFDNLGTTNAVLLSKYDASRSSSSSPTPSTTQVRTGTTSAKFLLTSTLCTKPLGASGTTFVVGFAFFIDATAFGDGASGNGYLCDVTEEDATIHLRLAITTAGLLKVYRNTTLLGTAVVALTHSTWYFIEFKGVIDDTVGTYEVRVDTVNILSATGQDTRNGGAGTWNRVVLRSGHTGGIGADYFDDYYICDGSGSSCTTFLGIQRVGSSIAVTDATSAGSNAAWTPSTGTDHGALVDENPPNGDTDYNASSTVGQKDTYHITAVSLTGTTRGIQVNRYLKKTDAGARQTCAVVRSAGTDYDQATQDPLTTYGYLTAVLEQDPATAALWAAAAINAAEFGEKVVT